MIVDQLQNAPQYYGLGPRFEKGLRYLQQTDFADVAPGRYELDGQRLFALVQEYKSKPRAEGFWEAHRKYADIQYVASGAEHMGYAPTVFLRALPYDAEKDFIKLEGEGEFFALRAGFFTILAPQDAHMPGMAMGESQPVKKVVVKVAV